ncbi:caspase family protein [Hoeflea sp. G2-23]|uniref:Caspase family protein n=1 Tax=Hoeflea algicola TaxID=2983763 RepID=A0ABT3ZES9_9HYPH|nr:caspase family protein [Hoeflea algicola]MCY0150218.1 caspase family protein [Hoeflea algicola]
MAALVLGNADYPGNDKLNNPVNDALDVSAKLKSYDFEVILGTDCSNSNMEKKLKEFATLLKTHEVGLFFFAGHGMQIDGSNYLLAIDTDCSSEIDAKHSSLSLDKVVEVMAKSKASTKIIVLDACRNNPWERAWHRDISMRGLASVYAPKGTIIGFATSPGELAADGSGRNGTYTEALLQHIDTKDCPVEKMFKRVRNTVAGATKGKQTTWEHTSLAGEFYFNLGIDKIISEYDETALADGLFGLDTSKPSHKIIEGLKSYNWYVQNPALLKLNADSVKRMGVNNLFVLGRNIYQAACGSSGAAEVFIGDFVSRTAQFEISKRKALLDGMLFEVFFDSTGNLRSKIKGEYFDEVFDLQKIPALKASFDFIADALDAAGADFIELPGRGHELDVTVSTKKIKAGYLVEAIFIGGKDLLQASESEWDDLDGIPSHSKTVIEQLNGTLSRELVVPQRLLKVTYAPAAVGENDVLIIPRGWSIRRA